MILEHTIDIIWTIVLLLSFGCFLLVLFIVIFSVIWQVIMINVEFSRNILSLLTKKDKQ